MIKKIKAFLSTHEDIAQLVKFTLFSVVAFAVEYATFSLLLFFLKGVSRPVSWFVFFYSESDGGLGAMLAFFISNVLAQIVTFILNRKKTFHATNNIVFSAVSYAIMVFGIIILNTWAGGAITTALNKSIDNLVICQYIGKLCGSFMAFVISFLGSKFIIMRKVKPKEQPTDSPDKSIETQPKEDK